MNELIHCPRCDKTKPISKFNKGTASHGYQTYCRECQRDYEREYWQRAKGRKKKWRTKFDERTERNRQFVYNYLLSHPCVDCGESDPVVLQFDHVRGEKANDVSVLVRGGVSIKRLETEIEKCEIRCANCHQIKTAYENRYWILKYLE